MIALENMIDKSVQTLMNYSKYNAHHSVILNAYFIVYFCRDLVITSSEKTSAENYLTLLALGMTLEQLSQSNKRKFTILA